MVKSNICHLRGMSPKQLIYHSEESEDLGGYFIVNGIEKLIRLLIVNRRNHPMAIIRPSFQKRGPTYSDCGVMIRCVRPDQTSHTITIHYLTDGAATIRFSYKKQEYMLPLVMVLKALIPTSDQEIYNSIVQHDVENTFLTDRIEMMLRSFKRYALYTQEQCLAFIGAKFRVILNVWDNTTDIEAGRYLLQKVVLVHLNDNLDKFNLLVFMIQKLYSLVAGECAPDNPDSTQHQEVLLGGFLYNMIMKEKLEDYLASIKNILSQELRRNRSVDFNDSKTFQRAVTRAGMPLGKAMDYFLATGNLVSNTGLDLSQASGYTIVAEKLNFYRYISHFRSIHRGSFFAELKTTAVRKLLPESWGFLCPVHTPDGSPCGLLNHLSHTCKIVTDILDVSDVPSICCSLGMKPAERGDYAGVPKKSDVKVFLDGKVIGSCSPDICITLASKLRYLKVSGKANIPLELEIGLVPVSDGGQFPGLFMFSQPSRMIRPVKYLANGKKDMVGSFEQVFMDIACLDEDLKSGFTTHQEFAPTNILSVIANLTPFSEFNQSPRNMYQCQMGKQSMGTPAHALAHRADNKLYRLMTGQTPVVRPELHNQYGMDNYPNGTNAVVAVISYTGYDMEDAMILNKMAYERGFAHGLIYKTEYVDLSDLRQRGEPILHHFGCPNPQKLANGKLDFDGFPFVGSKLTSGDPMYSYTDDITGNCKVIKYKGLEDAIVEDVRLLGEDTGKEEGQKIAITLRIPRNPIIGDKFCLTGDHEVLTKGGWVPISLVNSSHEVCSLEDGNIIKYTRPTEFYEFDMINEPLYLLNSAHVDMAATLDHKMLTKNLGSSKFQLKRARDIIGQTLQYKKNGVWNESNIPDFTSNFDQIIFYSEAWLAFMGLWMITGSAHHGISNRDTGGIEEKFDIYLDVNPLNQPKIQNLLEKLGMKWKISGKKTISLTEPKLAAYLSQFHTESSSRQLPLWCTSISMKKSRALIDGMILGSGKKGTLLLNSKPLCDQIQAIALHAGIAASIHQLEDNYLVKFLEKDNLMPIVNEMSTKSDNVIKYTGKVYCIEVPSHVFYARRNGKAVWTGNSSRHGQKGVCSQRYQSINLPFTESGMNPDIIINPHAFPSRMTIGMFVESMAGKAGALHGICQDATPFKFSEENTAVDFFGQQLKSAGYNYYGNEPMYSGITGEEMRVDIYIGLVYYQRLRHMVSDKYQVRTTGPIDNLTHQPVKGRKRAGGIRFGEMERDSLLAHGVSFCLNDRLMNCSDYSIAHACKKCGSILSPISIPAELSNSQAKSSASSKNAKISCLNCQSGANICVIQIPYVFRYLAAELMAMNVKLTLNIK